MRGWPLAPGPALVDPAVAAWCDEIDAAIDTGDLPRLERAQAALRMPSRERPPAPRPLVSSTPAPIDDVDDVEVPPQPPVVHDPPPAALAAPAGKRRGAWARRAR